MFVDIPRFRWLISITASIFLVSCDRSGANISTVETDGAAFEQHQSSSLVDVSWLFENIEREDLHLVELSSSNQEFSAAHIPSAKFVDWRSDISDPEKPDRYNLPPRSQHEQLLSRLGISTDSTIVLYDRLNNRAAVRMLWILKYYGHEDARVLDGGFDAWRSNGYALSDQSEQWEESDYRVSSINSDLMVDFNYVNDNLSSPTVKLVDGRPFDQYTGEQPGKVFHTGVEHKRPGHIYGAKTVPWADNLREDGTFKSPAELIKLYRNHEVYDDGVVITYCNEGLHAAMPWFVLHEILGYEDVRLYDDSMVEWANTFDTPMITGEHCM